MRFHHSTRRGRSTRLGGAQSGAGGRQASASSALRWAQLNYCRQTNIHFNRRLLVEPPPSSLALGGGGHHKSPPPRQPTDLATAPQLQLQPPAPLAAAAGAPIATEQSFDYGNPNEYQIASDQLFQGQQQQQQQQNLLLLLSDGTSASAETPTTSDQEPVTQVDHRQFENLLKLTDSETSRQHQQANTMTAFGATRGNSPQTPISHDEIQQQQQQQTTSTTKTRRHQQHNSASKKPSPTTTPTRAQNYYPHKSPPPTSGGTCLRANGGEPNASAPGTHTPIPITQQPSRQLDLELAREKLIAQVEKHPFWSNKAAKRMHLTRLDERRVFIYELISYCERRELEWRYEPYRGGLVKGSAPAGAYGTPAPSGAMGVGEPIGASRSQPATPPPANWSPAETPTGGGTVAGAATLASSPTMSLGGGGFSSSAAAARLQVPACGGANLPGAPNGHQNLNTNMSMNLNLNLNQANKSPIRRSRSSAAASPLRSPGDGGGGGATSCNQQQQDSAWNRNQSNLEPFQRPLPSGECVWSIEAPVERKPAPFTSSVHFSELPGSSFVKRCHGCQGRGRLKCSSCQGAGYEVCISCSGRGTLRALAGPSSAASRACPSRGGGAESSYSSFGGMWDNSVSSSAADSPGRAGRRDGEPGGVTGGAGSSSSGAAGGWLSESCHFCHGAGQKRCWICAGRAYNSCLACASTGQLRCYMGLNISWLNHRDECVLNNSNSQEPVGGKQQMASIVPRDRLKLSAGLLLVDEIAACQLQPVDLGATTTAMATGGATWTPLATFQQSQHRHPTKPQADTNAPVVPPANSTHLSPAKSAKLKHNKTNNSNNNNKIKPIKHNHHHPTQQHNLCSAHEADQLKLASSRLIERHKSNYAQEKLVRQRQRVTQVDCTVVHWEWKRRRGHFVIYGTERKVYIAKYPFKSICNIT